MVAKRSPCPLQQHTSGPIVHALIQGVLFDKKGDPMEGGCTETGGGGGGAGGCATAELARANKHTQHHMWACHAGTRHPVHKAHTVSGGLQRPITHHTALIPATHAHPMPHRQAWWRRAITTRQSEPVPQSPHSCQPPRTFPLAASSKRPARCPGERATTAANALRARQGPAAQHPYCRRPCQHCTNDSRRHATNGGSTLPRRQGYHTCGRGKLSNAA